jgi:hypothetical protein
MDGWGGGLYFLFLIAIVIGLIVLAVQYWQITVSITAIAIVIYLISKAMKNAAAERRRIEAEAARRKAEDELRLRQEEIQMRQYQEQQDSFRRQLITLCDNSVWLFETVPKYLREAEHQLDRADVDFGEGAFAPFWDAVENAAVNLGRFCEGFQGINTNLMQYAQVAKQYAGTPPGFPLARQAVQKLGVSRSTADRMRVTVRTAQRNFQFATIYEQRKTNQILVAGFGSLAQALHETGNRIAASIGSLADSVSGLARSLDPDARDS